MLAFYGRSKWFFRGLSVEALLSIMRLTVSLRGFIGWRLRGDCDTGLVGYEPPLSGECVTVYGVKEIEGEKREISCEVEPWVCRKRRELKRFT